MTKCTCKLFHALYRLVFGRNLKRRFCSRLVHFLFAASLGVILYYSILIDLNFKPYAALCAGLLISLMLGFGAAISSQIRCIIFLTIPTFGGQTGRSVIKTLVLAFIIAGPIENITTNGKEVVRVFACTTSLTYNLTKTRFELMFKPFSDALLAMKGDYDEVKDTLRSIRDVSAPIVGEIEDESEMRKLKEENDYIDQTVGDEPSRSAQLDEKYTQTVGEQSENTKFEQLYLKKIETRCEDQFSKAAGNCRRMFEAGYNKCYEAVTWVAAWLLCWPMKLDFVCNIAQALGGSNRCDPSKSIDPGLGEGYAYLKRARSEFSENFKHVKVQYKIAKFKHLIDVQGTQDSAKAIVHAVREKKHLLDQFLVLLKRFLAFSFLKVIISSQKYHDRYLTEIQFDNIYVTPYFRKIDARRRTLGKHYLLPLKKIERRKLTDPCSRRPLKKERQQLLGQSMMLFIEMITATIFILLDRLFYEGLDLVRRHAKIDYIQTGHHDMKLEVKGTGLIANLLRSIVRGFNVKKRIYIERSNERCLPRPKLLSNYYLYKIYGTYVLIWMMMWAQVYTQRLQRVICSFFYEKREKKRILFIYNETLRRRIGFYRHMRKKIQKMVRQHRLEEDFSVLMVLRIRYPKLGKWLKIFPSARQKCLICKDVEGKSCKLIECPNQFCYFTYCDECWNDMDQNCLVCITKNDTSTSEDDDGTTSGTTDI